MGGGQSEGNGTLAAFFPGAVFQGNIVIGASSQLYPAGNYFPATLSQVGFVDPSGNFRLSASSPYVNSATDGGAIGADIQAIDAAASTNY
jgi:hypothetical protein